MRTTEELCYHDYSIYETRQSQIDKNKILQVEVGMRCPHCGYVRRPIDHAKVVICDGCGLEMKRYGSSIKCTLKKI